MFPNKQLLISLLMIIGSTLACGSLAEGASSEYTIEEAAQIISEEADNSAVLIAVRVGDGPQEITTAGFANIDAETPIQSADSFRIGSMTKTFMGVLMLSLEEDGFFNLDDPAADYLPLDVYAGIENADDATLREMLQMTSGVFDYLENESFWDAYEDNPTYLWRPLEVLDFAVGEPANFAPGDGWSYSNTNYILAQLVAEQVTGQPLGALFEERVLSPAGMNDSYLEHYQTGPLVDSYEYGQDVTGYNDGTGMADGGLISTAADLDRFMRALEAGVIISEESLETLFEPAGPGEASEYGLGVELVNNQWGEAWGHTGATAGFSSEFWYLIDSDATVIVLRNSIDDVDDSIAGDAGFALATELAR